MGTLQIPLTLVQSRITIWPLGTDHTSFGAFANPDALVAVVSSLSCTAVVIPFIVGFVLFKERHFRWNSPCVVALFLGIFECPTQKRSGPTRLRSLSAHPRSSGMLLINGTPRDPW